MKEIWVPIKFKKFKHYSVSNYGHVRNEKTGYVTAGNVYYISPVRGELLHVLLSNKEYTKSIAVHKLVFMHFNKDKLSNKFAIWHNDLNGTNNEVPNLHKYSRGDILRMTYRNRKQPRGVYKWSNGNYTFWRATLKINGKTVTLGYTETKKDAINLYKTRYREIYGAEAY